MEARYDGVADWYDASLATTEIGLSARRVALRLLGEPRGRLLDVGCGTGVHTAAFADAGWAVLGVDMSEDQLRLARRRGCDVVKADAAALPFEDASFDAVASMWTHTDVDDFGAAVREAARVLRPAAPLVYVGVHPCFVGPHSRFVGAQGVPELHPGYREPRRYHEAPGISPEGLRARVGAVHLPLDGFLRAFLAAGLKIVELEEPADDGHDYPYRIALRAVA
jgi:SAM-dependent methyltransferase